MLLTVKLAPAFDLESRSTKMKMVIRTSDADPTLNLVWWRKLVSEPHQPLHVIQQFSQAYPHGDQGGNLIFVRPAPEADAIKLHAFWDNVVLSSEDPQTVRSVATELASRPGFEPEALEELEERPF